MVINQREFSHFTILIILKNLEANDAGWQVCKYVDSNHEKPASWPL